MSTNHEIPQSIQSSKESQPEGQKNVDSSFILTRQESLQSHRVIRSPQKLHLHPALIRLDLMHSLMELNDTHALEGQLSCELILITANRTIISGFKQWYKAVSDGHPQVDCIEYSLTEEEALEYILVQHRPRRGWNNFTRVRVALELESHFQRKALDNQIAGGKFKGSANLPKAEQIEVREEIASIAGVSGRTVSNVKILLKDGATALIHALQDGTLTINRALQWCSLPVWKQVEGFTNYAEQRASSKVICEAINRLPIQNAGSDSSAVLGALQRHEAQRPGSVVVRPSRRAQTVILLGQDLLSDPDFHTGLQTP